MIPACMGGWCSHRDRCERHTTDDRRVVAERLCAKGEEGDYRLVTWSRIGAWEHTSAPTRIAHPFDGIAA